jgi:hypothetical protein
MILPETAPAYRGFLFAPERLAGMIEKFESSDQDKTRSFDSRVQEAFLTYCELWGKYPHVLYVSAWHVDFRDPLLETRLDRTLSPSSFWLSAK